MSSIPPMMVQIELDLKELKTQVAKATKQLDELGAGMKKAGAPAEKLGEQIKGMAKGFIAFEALKKVGEFLNESGKAASANATSYQLMARQMKVTTGATDEQIKATDKQLESMALVAGMTTKTLRPSFSIFERTTGSTTSALKLQQIALDVAAGTGKNLTQVTLAMSRAMTGNTAALNKLVPGAKNAGDKIGWLETQFAGAAKTVADTNPYQKLQATFETIQENLGSAVLPLVSQFATWLQSIMPQLEKFFETLSDPDGVVAKTLSGVLNVMMGIGNFISQNISLVEGLVAGWLAYKAAITVVNIAMGIYKAVEEAGSVANWLFAASEAATGWGAIAVGIGLATAALVMYTAAQYGASEAPPPGSVDPGATPAPVPGDPNFMGPVTLQQVNAYYDKMPTNPSPGQVYTWYDYADGQDKPAVWWTSTWTGKSWTPRKRSTYTDPKKADANKSLADAKAKLIADVGDLQKSFQPAVFIEKQVGRIQDAVDKTFGKAGESLKKAFDSGAITRGAMVALQTYANAEKTTLDQIAVARDALSKKYDLAKSLMGSLKDNVSSLLGLDQLGNTARSAITQMDNVTKRITAFASNIAKLKASGASTDLIAQIAQGGVEQGSALAEGLAKATPDQIAAVNASWKAVHDASAGMAEGVATAVYGDGVDTANGLLNGIISQDKNLMTQAETMGQRFAKTFAMAVKAATTAKNDASFKKIMAGYMADNISPALNSSLTSANSTPWQTGSSSSSSIVVNNTNNTNASPSQIATQTINAIKFGLPVAAIGATS